MKHFLTLALVAASLCAYSQTNDHPEGEAKLAAAFVARPWVMDTTAADNIRVKSNAMAVVFENLQKRVKDKHWTNTRGWMSTTKGVPSDASGWVLFELISRDNGVSEIRLIYEQSRQQERLLMTSTKWALSRSVPNADHLLYQENIATGDFAVPEIKN